MEITFLKSLKNYPYSDNANNSDTFVNEGISLSEIQVLEQNWNNGNPFPKVLRELLFLSGNGCNVFDFGFFDSQQSLQEDIREDLEDFNKVINRPFYAIDVNTGYSFLFIYLDEGDNPLLHEATPSDPSSGWIRDAGNFTVKSYSEYAIDLIKKGENPY